MVLYCFIYIGKCDQFNFPNRLEIQRRVEIEKNNVTRKDFRQIYHNAGDRIFLHANVQNLHILGYSFKI